MPQIVVDKLIKTFSIAERTRGLIGAVKGLIHRSYRTVEALRGLSFTVENGELLGYIGPNGAGKSTTVKVLSGILVPDSGICTVNGMTPWKHRTEYVRSIGAVFGQRTQLWWDLPVADSFDLLRDIYSIDTKRYRHSRDELISTLDLAPFLDVPTRQLSLGQRMRCDLAASLLHEPKVLFLDEPTIGLDAVSKLAVRDFIRRINAERSVTVMLTTHDMDDIEALCSRVVLIDSGVISFDGTVRELRDAVPHERSIVVDLIEPIDPPPVDDRIAFVRREGHRVWFSYDPDTMNAPAAIKAITAVCAISDLFLENPPIEHIVASLYGQRK
ncbi:MAG: ATP-binding cassette domain-containing protein [Spirochaetes bacterium]|nr:ATP-binding cassette domain-containing protein [Spirochaetota bacterium]